MLGGRIGAHSAPQVGSVFWFTIPLILSEAPVESRHLFYQHQHEAQAQHQARQEAAQQQQQQPGEQVQQRQQRQQHSMLRPYSLRSWDGQQQQPDALQPRPPSRSDPCNAVFPARGALSLCPECHVGLLAPGPAPLGSEDLGGDLGGDSERDPGGLLSGGPLGLGGGSDQGPGVGAGSDQGLGVDLGRNCISAPGGRGGGGGGMWDMKGSAAARGGGAATSPDATASPGVACLQPARKGSAAAGSGSGSGAGGGPDPDPDGPTAPTGFGSGSTAGSEWLCNRGHLGSFLDSVDLDRGVIRIHVLRAVAAEGRCVPATATTASGGPQAGVGRGAGEGGGAVAGAELGLPGAVAAGHSGATAVGDSSHGGGAAGVSSSSVSNGRPHMAGDGDAAGTTSSDHSGVIGGSNNGASRSSNNGASRSSNNGASRSSNSSVVQIGGCGSSPPSPAAAPVYPAPAEAVPGYLLSPEPSGSASALTPCLLDLPPPLLPFMMSPCSSDLLPLHAQALASDRRQPPPQPASSPSKRPSPPTHTAPPQVGHASHERGAGGSSVPQPPVLDPSLSEQQQQQRQERHHQHELLEQEQRRGEHPQWGEEQEQQRGEQEDAALQPVLSRGRFSLRGRRTTHPHKSDCSDDR